MTRSARQRRGSPRATLQNLPAGRQDAASVAVMVLTTEALVTDIPEEKKEVPQMPGPGMGDY